ncbi:hypothetical protein AB0I82_02680 [Streptomyces sp. NPDC050315]|uniref:hypothetical protein n=1 Tax=Streptomyces sp. NPDC050315 TaxID=3155039 RepID=UPI003439FFBF
MALANWGIGRTMLAAAVISLIGAAVSMAWAPETRDLPLHECAALREQPAPAKPLSSRS